ncbi:hypothetical protein OSTOST_23707 [Ostertagia ostertagi]
MRTVLIALCVISLSSPWVIYRRNHKKKLVCKEDPLNSTTVEDSSEESITAVQPDGEEIFEELISRSKSDNANIHLSSRKNKTSKVHDDDFDLVSDQLSDEEIEEVKQQIRETCAALKIT